jgi:NADH-quinone oxidoreductase subunit G
MQGKDILRITGRKDEFGELENFICNTCRFDKKNASDWSIEGPRHIAKDSVIGQNLQINEKKLSNKVPDYDNKQRLLS